MDEASRLRLMTNQELWKKLLGHIVPSGDTQELFVVERELERRLRKIGFLPALPLKGEE